MGKGGDSEGKVGEDRKMKGVWGRKKCVEGEEECLWDGEGRGKEGGKWKDEKWVCDILSAYEVKRLKYHTGSSLTSSCHLL